MKIYVAHSSGYDYRSELYAPIKQSRLSELYSFHLPHDISIEPSPNEKVKETIKNCVYFVADVSYPSIGLGIEMGWAEMFGVPILVMHKHGNKISNVVGLMTKNIFTYKDKNEMIKNLEKYLNK